MFEHLPFSEIDIPALTEGFLQAVKDFMLLKCGGVPQVAGFLQDAPLWLYAAGVVVLAISVPFAVIRTLFAFKNTMDEKIRGSGLGAAKEKRRVMSEAGKLARKKEYSRSAELYLSLEENGLAIETLVKGGLHARAGQIYEGMGRLDNAAELYAKAGENAWLAEVLKKKGDYGRAGDIFLKLGKKLLAAESYEKAQRPLLAAPLYEEAGHTLTAARLYEDGSDFKKAAMLYDRAYVESTSSQEVHTADRDARLRDMSLKAGTYYEKTGEYEKAAEAFARCRAFKEAAQAMMKAGMRDRSAELYVSAKEYEKAAEVYREDGNTRRASEVMAEMHLSEGDEAQAGRLYMEAGDYARAGELLDRAGEYAMAGEAYYIEQDYATAAELFLKGGDKVRAAEAYEKGDWPKRAAELYLDLGETDRASALVEKSGDYTTAAELYRKMGKADRELAALQRVPVDDPRYNSAVIRLAEIFKAQGNTKLAGEKYAQAISGSEADQVNVDLFYGLAVIYEAEHRYDEAASLYRKAQLVDFHYKDLEERLKTCAKFAGQSRVDTKGPGGGGGGPAQASDDAVKRYKVLKEVGRGGMGVVYKAMDNNLNRVIALKLLPKSISENPNVIKRFAAEARSAAQLTHTNIVTLYDFQQAGGRSFITMEFVEGVTLKKLMGMTDALPVVKALKIIYQCCQGLDYAHKKGIIHRDIKPSNIMINPQNIVKIMDFGLAKVVGEETITEAGAISGTVMYMSPEQLIGDKLDNRTDIYSLGLVFYELLTGAHPFAKGDAAYHHVHTRPASPRELRPEIPENLGGIVLKCLEKDRTKRFESALQLALALRDTPLK